MDLVHLAIEDACLEVAIRRVTHPKAQLAHITRIAPPIAALAPAPPAAAALAVPESFASLAQLRWLLDGLRRPHVAIEAENDWPRCVLDQRRSLIFAEPTHRLAIDI